MFPNRPSGLRSSSLVVTAVAASALAGILTVQTARASLIAYEPFNYTAGSSLNGQAANSLGFTGTWSGGTATINSGSLTYGSLATSGNSLAGGATEGTQLDLTTPVSATVGNPLWISFLMQTPSASDVTTGWGGLVLYRSSSDSVFTYPFIGYANSGVFVLQTQGGENDVNGPSVSGNTTYLMVLEDVANSSGPDTLKLWVDPTPGVSSPAGSPTITDSLIGPIGDIYGLGTNDGAPTSYDEFRVGTTYADVTPVPEPAALGLLGIGAAGLLMLNRRRVS